VPESSQVLYKICRVYIKEDIFYSDQGPILSTNSKKRAAKVAMPPVAAGWCDQSSVAATHAHQWTKHASSIYTPCPSLLLPWPSTSPSPRRPLPLQRRELSPMAVAPLPSSFLMFMWRRPPLRLWHVGPRRHVSTKSCRFLCCVLKFISRVLELLKSWTLFCWLPYEML
jgi:hypothetical protein